MIQRYPTSATALVTPCWDHQLLDAQRTGRGPDPRYALVSTFT